MMNKNIILVNGVFVLSMYTVTSLAGTVTIPNTFVSGQIARASSINNNFNAIAEAVDDNANNITDNTNNIAAKRIGIVKDSNGSIIGTLLGIDSFGTLTLISSKGYMFRVNQDGNLYWRPSSIEYDSADCAGNPYIDTVQSVDWDGVNYLYVQKGTATTYINTFSYKYSIGSTCNNYGTSNFHYKYLAKPNDPGVTGVNNSSINMPITIDFQ